jgi:hypothetical protein
MKRWKKMTKLRETLSKLQNEIPFKLAELNGVASNELRELETKWPGTSPATVLFESEIISRFRHGVSQEIGSALFNQAIESASMTLQFNKDFAFSDVAVAVRDQADALGETSIVVVTTMGMRMLQIDPLGLFVRNDKDILSIDVDGPLGLTDVGKLQDHVVYCNPYAADPDTTMILGDGWFQYSGATLIDALPGDVDPETGQATLVSDLKIEVVSALIRAIKVQADAVKFR